MKLEVGKFYKTRAGDKVRVLLTDLPEDLAGRTVLALVNETSSDWDTEYFMADGSYSDPTYCSDHDIVSEWREPKTVKVQRYVVVWPDGDTQIFRDENEAINWARPAAKANCPQAKVLKLEGEVTFDE